MIFTDKKGKMKAIIYPKFKKNKVGFRKPVMDCG